jgi:Protein of unknown function (DUF2817)
MMDIGAFSSDYAQAREKFRLACASRGLEVQSFIHPLRGMQGEELAIDVARRGAADAPQLLVLSSGCHGVEGFCGSGVQVDLLRDDAWNINCDPMNVAVLYIHAINPYGFSWLRRVTHENIDLNRNFREFGQPVANNAGYGEVAPHLLPRACPPTLRSSIGMLAFSLRHGRRRLQEVITRGQDADPAGLFYAGRGPAWSHRAMRTILREHGQRCRRIGWIDVHTGLGPAGFGEKIYKGRNDAASISRARQWWGPGVTCAEEGNSASMIVDGTLDCGVMRECPQAQYNGLTLEYGTAPGRAVLDALRSEQWLQLHPEAADAVGDEIRRRFRDAFYVDTDEWKYRVLFQARTVMQQTLDALSNS